MPVKIIVVTVLLAAALICTPALAAQAEQPAVPTAPVAAIPQAATKNPPSDAQDQTPAAEKPAAEQAIPEESTEPGSRASAQTETPAQPLRAPNNSKLNHGLVAQMQEILASYSEILAEFKASAARMEELTPKAEEFKGLADRLSKLGDELNYREKALNELLAKTGSPDNIKQILEKTRAQAAGARAAAVKASQQAAELRVRLDKTAESQNQTVSSQLNELKSLQKDIEARQNQLDSSLYWLAWIGGIIAILLLAVLIWWSNSRARAVSREVAHLHGRTKDALIRLNSEMKG